MYHFENIGVVEFHQIIGNHSFWIREACTGCNFYSTRKH